MWAKGNVSGAFSYAKMTLLPYGRPRELTPVPAFNPGTTKICDDTEIHRLTGSTDALDLGAHCLQIPYVMYGLCVDRIPNGNVLINTGTKWWCYVGC